MHIGFYKINIKILPNTLLVNFRKVRIIAKCIIANFLKIYQYLIVEILAKKNL